MCIKYNCLIIIDDDVAMVNIVVAGVLTSKVCMIVCILY